MNLYFESYERLNPSFPFTGEYTHLLSPGHPHPLNNQEVLRGEAEGAESCLSFSRDKHCPARPPSPHITLSSTVISHFATQLFLCLLWLLLIIPESSRNVKSHDRRSDEGGWGRGYVGRMGLGVRVERESKRKCDWCPNVHTKALPFLCFAILMEWEEDGFHTAAKQIELWANISQSM